MSTEIQNKKIVGGDWVDELQAKAGKNTTRFCDLIFREDVYNGSAVGTLPYWFPSGRGKRHSISRKGTQYNRHDNVYKGIVKHIQNSEHGLEVHSDIGRSTGFLASVTREVTVIEDALEWVDIYDGQTRNIARRLGKPRDECILNWHYGGDWIDGKYDWIKLEIDAYDRIDKAVNSLRPGGKLIIIGDYNTVTAFKSKQWARNFTAHIDTEPGRGNTIGTKNCYIVFELNTNGENK